MQKNVSQIEDSLPRIYVSMELLCEMAMDGLVIRVLGFNDLERDFFLVKYQLRNGLWRQAIFHMDQDKVAEQVIHAQSLIKTAKLINAAPTNPDTVH